MFKVRIYFLVILLGIALGFSASPMYSQSIDDLQRSFIKPPDDARIMMRWWWFGPAVTKPEIEREMRVMKAGGIGGFEVQAVYPLSLDDPSRGIKNGRFLDDEFIDNLRFTAAKARELGLRMDLTLGSGWPFGGPTVSIDEAAGGLRVDRVPVAAGVQRVKLPSVAAGEKLLAIFLAKSPVPTNPEGFRELTEIKDGAVLLPEISVGPQEVQFYISSRSGMQVKRPAIGGEGFVLDHLNRSATDNYLRNVGDRLMQAFGTKPPFAIFCDSLEVYNQDWSADFLAEFQRRRGYDLKPYLPALANDIGPKTLDIRYDWGRTVTELLNERFLAPMQEWAKRNHTKFRIQNYGTPPATISSSKFADLPEGEGSQWTVVRASRWASSASHIYGRPVTSSETWTWLHSPVFRVTPLDMKAEADLHFLQGINQLIGHGWPYTPPGVDYPGNRFYAAAVFDEKNPWWTVMPDISLYLQRVSHLMRQGHPANDIAFYLPNADAYAHMTPGKVNMIETQRDLVGPEIMPTIFAAGYNLDFFDDEALTQVGRVEANSLMLGQNKYRVVILPGVEQIPISTWRVLDQFVQNGGILIATRFMPQWVPGAQATGPERTEAREISRRLFRDRGPSAHFVRQEGRELAAKLVSVLRPDLATEQLVPDVGFIHRSTAVAEIYFIANTSNLPHRTNATFRVEALQPEWWNPLTGEITAARVEARPSGGTTVALDLEPYGSRVLVFSKRTLPSPRIVTSYNSAPPPLDLSHDWQVKFSADGPTSTMADLRSWTDTESTRFFSGTAAYEKQLDVPTGFARLNEPVYLDLGEGKPVPPQALRAGMQTWYDAPVREAAVIYINGKRAGAVWCPPYRLRVNGLLQSGTNTIRIEVSNLALNYMAGRALPDYRLLSLRYGERFQAQDMDKVLPITAGLLGPIRLMAGKENGQ
ncbi:MAG: glycosyl hydrolase [Pyrinomonadaceae bacterium]